MPYVNFENILWLKQLILRVKENKIVPVFISVINQLDAQNFCFTISLLHACTCFEHVCSKQKFCASSWLITEINVLRCTVSNT